MNDKNNIWLQWVTFCIACYQAPFIYLDKYIKDKERENKS